MAEDVVEHTIAAPRAEPEPLVAPRRQREHPRVYRWRFGLAYLVLAALAGAGVGIAIMLLDRPDAERVAWSEWQPTGREASYADQIAERVAPGYRLGTGGQPIAIVAREPSLQGVPVEAVVIQDQAPYRASRPNIEGPIRTPNTVMYVLCAFGPQCSMSAEAASSEQAQLLLQRAALELSLYTFKYVEGAESTLVVLPPDLGENVQDPSDDTNTTLFLQKKDFGRQLSRPLTQTLTPTGPNGSAQLGNREALLVNGLAAPNLFQYEPIQLPTGEVMMGLVPFNTRR